MPSPTTTTEQKNTAAPKKDPKKATRKHSTAHFRVDIKRAQILATNHPDLSVVEIRECLEGAPLKQAVNLIHWAERRNPNNPYKPLKNWAKRNQAGFYSPTVRGLDSNDHYQRCMLFIRDAEEKMLQTSGRNLLPRERENLAWEYYAPRYRAEMTEAAKFPPPPPDAAIAV